MPDAPRAHRKRVLFITYNFPPKLGGIEQVVLRTWNTLSEQADVITLAQFGEDFEDDDSPIHRPTRSGLVHFFAYLYRTGRRIVAQEPVDIVVSMSALTALPAAHLAKRAGAKSVVITYGLDTIYTSPVYQAMYRYAMPKMDRVVAISNATRDETLSRGVAIERTVIVHPGCDAERFLSSDDCGTLQAQWNLGGTRVILIAGRLVKRKGVDRFIRECLPQIVEDVPEAKLLLAGGNPVGALAHTEDMEHEVAQAISDTGLDEHILLTGRLSSEEMVAAFHLAEVVILPVVPTRGDMEGFGIVLLEAAAAGKPTVATRTGGIPDAVQDGVTGTLVSPGDYNEMATAVVAYLRDDEKARRCGEAGRARTLADFSWEGCARRYAEAILST
jgi:phosphatidyl-myo-inositol dimannoside synthase